MVAGYEHQRRAEPVHQLAQIFEWEVAAGDDELGPAYRMPIRQQRVVHFIRDGEDEDHMPIVRGGPPEVFDSDGSAALASECELFPGRRRGW